MSTEATQSSSDFEFVQILADKLSSGSIELPSFPDAVIRLRQVLSDENSTTEQIAQLLAAEPMLAARLLRIANSAALRPGTEPITDLNRVINRIGRNMVRNAAMSFGVKQAQETQKLKQAQPFLREVWDESTHVAALSYVLAKRYTKLNPDEALLVGLLHSIGKLFILSEAENQPELFADEAVLRKTLNDWHAPIGSAILESWDLSEELSFAVSSFQDTSREHEGPPDLTDVLTIACLLACFLNAEADAEFQLNEVSASRYLEVSTSDILPVIQESEESITSLRQALGG
ncbi:MAG: HDOD domain-containing protein [Gammaproteobacteria bacterium]